MSNKPIFLFNAPKRCGKDTVANHMFMFDNNLHVDSFKTPMFEVFENVIPNALQGEYLALYDQDDWKDTPHALLNGKTPRELMIHISENFIKPFFGERYYGESLADRILDCEEEMGEQIWVIPDCGFYEEVDAMWEAFGDRIIVVQFTRPGFESFTGDSRDFVEHPGVRTVVESNEDGSEALALRLMGYIYNG